MDRIGGVGGVVDLVMISPGVRDLGGDFMGFADEGLHSRDWEGEVLAVVERVWGYCGLRPMQREAIGAGLSSRRSSGYIL